MFPMKNSHLDSNLIDWFNWLLFTVGGCACWSGLFLLIGAVPVDQGYACWSGLCLLIEAMPTDRGYACWSRWSLDDVCSGCYSSSNVGRSPRLTLNVERSLRLTLNVERSFRLTLNIGMWLRLTLNVWRSLRLTQHREITPADTERREIIPADTECREITPADTERAGYSLGKNEVAPGSIARLYSTRQESVRWPGASSYETCRQKMCSLSPVWIKNIKHKTINRRVQN